MAGKTFDPIFVADGDTVVIIARTQQVGPTVSDPCDASPYLSQAYRVVSDRVGPTLALVPIGARVSVCQNQIDEYVGRKAEADAKKVDAAIDAIRTAIKESGWKFDASILSRVVSDLQNEAIDRNIELGRAENERFRRDLCAQDARVTATVECPVCYHEEGSHTCVRPYHKTTNDTVVENWKTR